MLLLAPSILYELINLLLTNLVDIPWSILVNLLFQLRIISSQGVAGDIALNR